MWDEDGIEPRSKGRIDVGLGTVADHPCRAALAAVVRRKAAVSRVVLFGQHLDGAEVRSKAGAAKLVSLLDMISLGDEDETMACRKLCQRLLYVRKKLDLLICNGLSEADDSRVLIRSNRTIGKLLKAGDQRLPKAMQTIAARGYGSALDAVKPLANLLGVINSMVKIGDERSDCPLKINVVLPKRIVRIDEKGLVRRVADGLGFAAHWG